MLALVAKIYLVLLVAALLGGVIGWLMNRLATTRERGAFLETHQRAAAALADRLAVTERAATEAADELERQRRNFETRGHDLATAVAARAAAESSSATVAKELAQAKAEARAAEQRMTAAQNDAHTRAREVAELRAERDRLAQQLAPLTGLPERVAQLERELKQSQRAAAASKERVALVDKENSDLHKRLRDREAAPARPAGRDPQWVQTEQRLAAAERRIVALQALEAGVRGAGHGNPAAAMAAAMQRESLERRVRLLEAECAALAGERDALARAGERHD